MIARIASLAAVAAISAGVAACGGSSSGSSSSAAASSSAAPASSAASSSSAAPAPAAATGGGSGLAISADPTGALKFSTTHLQAKAGTVHITFTNKAPEGHNFTLKSASGATVGATPTFNGGTKTLTAHLKPGTYTFLCTVPGHAAGGMKGTLTVK